MDIYIVWNCKLCKQTIDDPYEKQIHIFKHLNLDTNKYTCLYCNLKFDTLENYLKHCISKYFEIKYECSCCKNTSTELKYKI